MISFSTEVVMMASRSTDITLKSNDEKMRSLSHEIGKVLIHPTMKTGAGSHSNGDRSGAQKKKEQFVIYDLVKNVLDLKPHQSSLEVEYSPFPSKYVGEEKNYSVIPYTEDSHENRQDDCARRMKSFQGSSEQRSEEEEVSNTTCRKSNEIQDIPTQVKTKYTCTNSSIHKKNSRSRPRFDKFHHSVNKSYGGKQMNNSMKQEMLQTQRRMTQMNHYDPQYHQSLKKGILNVKTSYIKEKPSCQKIQPRTHRLYEHGKQVVYTRRQIEQASLKCNKSNQFEQKFQEKLKAKRGRTVCTTKSAQERARSLYDLSKSKQMQGRLRRNEVMNLVKKRAEEKTHRLVTSHRNGAITVIYQKPTRTEHDTDGIKSLKSEACLTISTISMDNLSCSKTSSSSDSSNDSDNLFKMSND